MQRASAAPALTSGSNDAQDAGCVATAAEGDVVTATPMGHIASFFYLKYTTMAFLRQYMGPAMDLQVRAGLSPVAAGPRLFQTFLLAFWS